MSRLGFIFALSLAVMNAQTMIDLGRQGKNVDFTKAATTAPIKTSATLPAACSVGDMVFLTTPPGGAALYACASSNVWVKQGTTNANDLTSGTLADARLSQTNVTQ